MRQETTAWKMDLALRAGQLMLENGGETYRVEETIERICSACGLREIQCFCVPTGLFLSARDQTATHTRVVRTRKAAIDLEIIDLLSKFSRDCGAGSMDAETASQSLRAIERAPRFRSATRVLFAGVASGFFALLWGGTLADFFGAFVVGALVIGLLDLAGRVVRSYFIRNLLGGSLVAGLALGVHALARLAGLGAELDLIVIGALMPLVPGVAITNALRDILSGDYVSGMSRLSEAIFIAVGMALGTGLVLMAVRP